MPKTESLAKKVAIMQPYLFPYLGYFQLINYADTFVFYDDVNYIKQGWINKNSIATANGIVSFVVPLSSQSSFTLIKDTHINKALYNKWKKKSLRMFAQNYSGAPFLKPVLSLIEECFNNPDTSTISELSISSVQLVLKYLDIEKDIKISSDQYSNQHLSKWERVIDICKTEEATEYVNPLGGKELYDKETFAEHNLLLSFLQKKDIHYTKQKGEFQDNLSIIDVLMWNDKDSVNEFLNQFELS